MSDVEGVRNLLGTGLIDFVGGIMTAIIALVLLLRISVQMTAVAFVVLLIFGVGAAASAFKTIRPIYRARPKINAEVTGRLTESLGGVRVVKGYHAEEREEKVFAAGVQRLLRKRAGHAHGHFADDAFRHRADGHRQRGDHVHGRARKSSAAR